MKYLKSFNESRGKYGSVFIERGDSKDTLLKPTTSLIEIWYKLQRDIYGTKIRELSDVRFGKMFNDYLKFVLEDLTFSLSLTDNNTTVAVTVEKDGGITENLGDYNADDVDSVIQVILKQLK